MDGPWQIGHMPARDYGRKARDAAQQMRVIDPKLQLVACGSSSPGMPTYLVWDREMLEECYDQVDAISLHNYYGNTTELTGGSTARYLAMNLDMERQIREIATVCDYVQGLRKTSKRLWLSFDEWNVWYRARDGSFTDGQRRVAPPLVEEVYNLEDALLIGGFVNTLLRQSDRVRIGCLAQIVNVIAPLLTNATSVLRQSIYYPYAWGLKYARGRVLDLGVECETYPVKAAGPAARLRAGRAGALPRRGRDDRSAERPGLRADPQSRSRRCARGGHRMGNPGTDTGPGLRDPDRPGPEGVQHLRCGAACGAAAARPARRRSEDDPRAAGTLVYRAAPRHGLDRSALLLT